MAGRQPRGMLLSSTGARRHPERVSLRPGAHTACLQSRTGNSDAASTWIFPLCQSSPAGHPPDPPTCNPSPPAGRAWRGQVAAASRAAHERPRGRDFVQIDGARERESVEAYLELALARTPLPADVPHQIEVAYTPRGEQAVVRFELPPPEVIPAVASYTYVGTTGEMREKKRAASEIGKRYRSVVSQIALLYMRDLFEADPELENVELGGHVHAISPATGQREYPCLISFAVDRARYSSLNLRDVTPEVCLTHLNALVSRHPHAAEPVTPVRDFDLARYSFVESVDVVSGLDSRPVLTRMTPTEFEHFVRQLFEARGLEGVRRHPG